MNREKILDLTFDLEEQAENLDDVTDAFLGHDGERNRALNRLYNIAEEIRRALDEEVPDNEEVSG